MGMFPGEGWYRVYARSDATAARIDLYGVIGGDDGGITADAFNRDLRRTAGPVELHINSHGGDLLEAFAMYHALMERGQVTTVVDGEARSAASIIAMAGQTRLGCELSVMELHEAWGLRQGSADDLVAWGNRLNELSDQMAGVYSRATGGADSPEHWRAKMRAETLYTAEEAVAAGLLTGLIRSGRVVPAAALRRPAARNRELVMAAAQGGASPEGRAAQLAQTRAEMAQVLAAGHDADHLPGSARSTCFDRVDYWERAGDDAHARWDAADREAKRLRSLAGEFPNTAEAVVVASVSAEAAGLFARVQECQHYRQEALREIESARRT